MKHVTVATSSSRRKDIETRLTGRFYTPPRIVDALVRAVLERLDESPSVIADPFCGDGRLLVSLLRHLLAKGIQSVRRIIAWDVDPAAVETARSNIAHELAQRGLESHTTIDARVCDSFDLSVQRAGIIDVVVTNPPWDLLKPDVRDGVRSKRAYSSSIRRYADQLRARYPNAASVGKKGFAGYDVNLARAGALASLELLRPDGQLGIVLPRSIFADHASSSFRRELLSKCSVTELTSYPAELRLFPNVDQPFVVLCARSGLPTTAIHIGRAGPGPSVQPNVLAIRDPALPLPVDTAPGLRDLLEELERNHPQLLALEATGLRLGRELDETRIAEFFASDSFGVPFLKGRDVNRFQAGTPSDFIDPKKRKIPPSVDTARIAWRDVSRPNQVRRMHAALVPDGTVTGNSLSIAYFHKPDATKLRVLLALMNSLVFEVQVRAKLATAHISKGTVREIRIPEGSFADASTGTAIIDQLLIGMRSGDFTQLEVTIAEAYGLSRDAFAELLQQFPKLPAGARNALLEKDRWS